MKHYCGPFLKRNDGMDMAEGNGPENRLLVDGAYDKFVGFYVNIYVMHYTYRVKQHGDVNTIDALGAVGIFLVKGLNDFFCYHDVRDMESRLAL